MLYVATTKNCAMLSANFNRINYPDNKLGTLKLKARAVEN